MADETNKQAAAGAERVVLTGEAAERFREVLDPSNPRGKRVLAASADPTTPAAGAGPTAAELARMVRQVAEMLDGQPYLTRISAAGHYLLKNADSLDTALNRLAELTTLRPGSFAPEGELVLWHLASGEVRSARRWGSHATASGFCVYVTADHVLGWTPLPAPAAQAKEATQP